MKNKWTKRIVSFVFQVVVTTILLMTVLIVKDGMYLMGVPSIKEVQKVTLSYPEISNETKEFTDSEQIELAVKLTGFLKYSLFEKPDTYAEPMITITYQLKSGKLISVSANEETVWWKNKTYAIKDKKTFVTLTESIFFFSEINMP